MRSLGKTDPANMEVHIPDRTLTIQWGDGHRSVYSFDLLRKECPCAVCREIRQAAKDDPFQVVTSAEKVGLYALRFTWSDGHDTGIYSYDYLRATCPCEICRAH
jgi:DUF971 family protein